MVKAEPQTFPLVKNRRPNDQSSGPFQGLKQLTTASSQLKLFGQQNQEQGKSPVDNATTQLSLLKKRFCQKLAPLIQNLYSIDKDKSKNLTLLIENRIRSFYSENSKDYTEDYKQGIRAIYRLIKVRIFCLCKQSMSSGQIIRFQNIKLY